MVVSNELKEPIRSHHDIDRDSAKHFKRASKVTIMPRFCSVMNAHLSRSSTRHSLNEFLLMVMLWISSPAVSTKSGSSK